MAEDFKLILYKLPKEKELLTHQSSLHSISAFLKICNVAFDVEERLNVSNMTMSGVSPLVRAITSKQELYLESLEEVVAFLQAQGATRVMDVQFLGKHTAFVTLVQSTFDLAENYLQWVVEENVKTFTKPRLAHSLPWPLSHLVTHKTTLTYWWNHSSAWKLSMEHIEKKVENLCTALETLLEEESSFFPKVIHCPLDALVWGHLEVLMTASVPVNPLSVVLRQHQRLKHFHQSYGSFRGDLGLFCQ